jgi:anti-sigma regulatory factor (Ser/Thr protein kinase)
VRGRVVDKHERSSGNAPGALASAVGRTTQGATPERCSWSGDRAMTTLDSSLDLPPLEFRTHSHPRSVTETRRRVGEYAEVGGANRRDVELAVTEAVTNAVVHAFVGRDNGVITVRAEIEGPNQLLVEVADNGAGITTPARSPQAGYGLPIIGAVTDSLEIHTGDWGTRLELRFARVS